MLDQQIESVSNKLVQFIQDLSCDIQRSLTQENVLELFQLRSDYAKQLASLFDILIHQLVEEYLRNRTIQMRVNLDPVQIWRSIQTFIDQLSDMQWQELDLIIKHIRNINKYFYNLLLQVKNVEFLKADQTRTLNQSLIEELNYLSESLLYTATTLCSNSNPSKPLDTYLFQNATIPQYSNNNNNHINLPSDSPSAINSNCCPPPPPPPPPPQTNWITNDRPPCLQPKFRPFFPNTKPMGCTSGPVRCNTPAPLCFPTPVVYTPEMETLFSSGGIIYARKSGNTWVAENLGTLIETLKEIGETIDMNEHCQILVRKTGELFVRQKKGRRKRFLQQTLNKGTSHGNHAYEQSDTDTTSNDQ